MDDMEKDGYAADNVSEAALDVVMEVVSDVISEVVSGDVSETFLAEADTTETEAAQVEISRAESAQTESNEEFKAGIGAAAGNRVDENPPFERVIEVNRLARAFVPRQRAGETFDSAQALRNGTAFPELYMPYDPSTR